MKKTLSLLLLILAYSCSSDKDVIDLNYAYELKKKELEVMYISMVTSEEYKKLDIAIASYLDKLNISNNDYLLNNEFNLMPPEDKYKWIAENLADTKFNSVEEAKIEDENILKLQEEVLKNHQEVYDAYGDEANHKILNELSRKYDPEYQQK